MKTFWIVALLGLSSAVNSSAQTAPAVKISAKGPKLAAIQTPIVIPSNVPDKNWRPRTWLECDLEIEARLPSNQGGRNGSVASITVNFYLAMNAQTADGKRHVLKGTLNYLDLPASTKCHALAFATPGTLRRVLERDNFSPSDVAGWGYEVVVDGAVVAGDSSAGGKWWEKGDGFAISEGALIAKQDTPFSILWGDYDLPTKSR
jgi:hypothetical protein